MSAPVPQLSSPSASQMVAPPPKPQSTVRNFGTLSAPPRPPAVSLRTPAVTLRPPAVRLNNVSPAVRLMTPVVRPAVRPALNAEEQQGGIDFLDDLHASNSNVLPSPQPSRPYMEERNSHRPPQPISVHHGQPIRTLGARQPHGPTHFRGGMYRSPSRFPPGDFRYNEHQPRMPRKRPFQQYNYGPHGGPADPYDGYY